MTDKTYTITSNFNDDEKARKHLSKLGAEEGFNQVVSFTCDGGKSRGEKNTYTLIASDGEQQPLVFDNQEAVS